MKKSYLLFALLSSFLSLAQTSSPGGIQGVEIEYWLKADQVSQTKLDDEDSVNLWEDLSGKNRNFISTLPFVPKYIKSAMNFNAAVDFYYLDPSEDGPDTNGNRSRQLHSLQNFEMDKDRSYFVIHVSKVDTDNTGSYGVVFALNSGHNNDFGWRGGSGSTGGKLYDRIQNTAYTYSNPANGYGIGMSVIPNKNGANALPHSLYLNALISSTGQTNRILDVTAAISVIGGKTSGNAPTDYFFGQVQEIIVLSKPAGLLGATLSADEMKKINSYLAIKYGITLDNTAQSEYLLSNGTVVYDSNSPGYQSFSKDIFGIAKDTASDLYQKQSQSYDNPLVTVFLGSLADVNSENNATLINEQALMFGSNGAEDEIPYVYGVGQQFVNYTLKTHTSSTTDALIDEQLGTIQNYKLKAKVTGSNSMQVNFKTGLGKWLLVSSDPSFEPFNTRIYKTNAGVANNVLINDGDYVGFANEPILIGKIFGINLEYWLKANMVEDVLPEDGGNVNTWKDVSGNNRDFIASTNYLPKYISSSMNFNAAVDFYFLDSADGGPSTNNNKLRQLQSLQDFEVKPDRSYFVIHVSNVDTENTGSYGAVFALNSGRNNDFGWRGGSGSTGGKLYDRIQNTAYTYSNPSNGYGIGMSVIPNKTGGGSLPHGLYLNGLISSTGQVARALDTRKGVSVIGGKAGGNVTNDFFFGEVQEIIVLSKPAGLLGATLTSDEIKKINSYLAIKYGITLDKTGQSDYVLSDGTVIYDSNSSGYTLFSKDIFGIAKDVASGLNQMQSASYDNSRLVICLGDFKETNDQNNFQLPDKNALVLGANGEEGESQYAYSSGTKFLNYTLKTNVDPITGVSDVERLSTIFNYKYKAKVTTPNNKITVNVHPGLGQWLLIGSDPDFDPESTRIYKIEAGLVNNLEINDGDYIGFAFFLRAPGGVTNGLVMWMNASESSTIVTNSNDEVVTWVDYSGFGTTYRRKPANNKSAKYVKADERTNFHPTLIFDSATDYLVTENGPMSVAAPLHSTFYTVVNHNFNSDRSYFLSFGSQNSSGSSTRRPVFGVFSSGNQGLARIRSQGATNSVNKLFNPGATMIAGYHWTMKSTIEFEFDAHSQVRNHTSSDSRMNGPGVLGAGSLTSSFLSGTMPEVIAYEGVLNQDERNKINSYLGLKYGITLDLDKNSIEQNFDYYFSNTNDIWIGNDAIHKNYHNNIASVIRDDGAALLNQQARSTDLDPIVHMGVGTKLGVNAVLDSVKDDYSAITCGHNNLSLTLKSFAGDPNICGTLDSKLSGRIWLADNKNFKQDILVAAYGESFPYDGASFEVFMLVADSAEKLENNNWDQSIPMAYVDEMHLVNYNFVNEFTYFTFAAKRKSNCQGCDFEGIKTFDFTKFNWARGAKGPENFNLGTDFNITITVDDPANVSNNLYPRPSTQKTLREKRRGGPGTITTKVAFKNDAGDVISSIASFELFSLNRQGNILDDVQVVGICSGSRVYPKITYAYAKPERSKFTINNQGKVTAKPRGVRFNGGSGYTDKRGRAIVEFEDPVEEIQIIYTPKISKSSRSSSEIGIGPMQFFCAAPLPSPNEDGLILTKQAPSEVRLCDVVDYVFRVVNTNCFTKEFEFSDTLPDGMVWVNDSFSAGIDIPDDNITGYGTNVLNVKGLTAPGGAEVFALRASAVFVKDAIAGSYSNRAKLIYEQVGVSTVLESVDRLTGEPFSITTALESIRPDAITTSFTINEACFVTGKEIEVDLKIENPNTFNFSDMLLSFDFESEIFSYVPNSLQTSQNLILGTNQGEEGGLEFDNFDLPQGTSWVKFRLLATEDLDAYEIDQTTNRPMDVSLGFNLFSEGDQNCSDSVFVNSNDDLDLPYCVICYYQSIPGDNGSIEDSEGYMAITNLNRTDMNWTSLRGNAFVVLESNTKGFVITRLSTVQINNLKPIEGMLVYDTTINCVKLFNGTNWGCLTQGCVDE